MNTFSKVKFPDERFCELRENICRLEENLQTLEKVYVKVIKKHIDLEQDLAEISSGITSLGVLETEVTDAMTRIGAILYEQTKVLSACTHHEDIDFTSNLRDYLSFCGAVRQVLKLRESKHLDHEVLNDALVTTQKEIQRLYSGGNVNQTMPNGSGGLLASSGQAIGNFFKEKYEELKGTDQDRARQDKIVKLELKEKELTREVALAQDVLKSFSDEVAKEIDFFHAARSVEFKEIFAEYADGQIQYFQKVLCIILMF
jgi:sorting nexin-4